MPWTQAIYYRDEKSAEPVDAFIEALPKKRAVKIDEFIEERLYLVVLLHAFEKDAGAVTMADKELVKRRMENFRRRMDADPRVPPRAAGRDAPPSRR